MNKWLVCFCILSVALIIVLSLKSSVSVSSSPNDTNRHSGNQVSNDEDWRIFRDRPGHYQIHYPGSWKLVDNSTRKQMIRADLNRDQTTGIQIRFYTSSRVTFKLFVDWYVKQFMTDMQKHWRGSMTEIERTYGFIGSHEGCSVSLILKRSDGQQWFLKQYLWPRGKNVVVFQCGTKFNLRAENEQTLDEIAQTFEFTE
ncbi:hypothetical protein ACFL27_10100 [candidate division CSSED10-310 bacterium]|uniref:DUF1795 domain-containing protein n=1 Tax=candidate division CSSED10-310 bacterium TaxID=2855610 RepID=A0ABV6YWR5_UNCC1